jgi:hypothetical protein
MKKEVNWSIKQEIIGGLPQNRIICHNPWLDIWWSVPGDFVMPDRALLSMVEYLLIGGFVKEFDDINNIGYRYPGEKVALAYSGGLDSTAAHELIPHDYSFYINYYKSQVPPNILDAQPMLPCLTVVHTNMHDFCTKFGVRSGLWRAGMFNIPSILYADYYDLKMSVEGHVFDLMYLRHKTNLKYHTFTKLHNAFKQIGVYDCLPVVGMSAILTHKIVTGLNSQLTPHIRSCTLGPDYKPCGKCWKCFRRKALWENKVGHLDKNVIEAAKTGKSTSVVFYLYKYRGFPCEIFNPDSTKFFNSPKQVEWVGQWYDKSIDFIPEAYRGQFLNKLSLCDIKPVQDETQLLKWNGALPKLSVEAL